MIDLGMLRTGDVCPRHHDRRVTDINIGYGWWKCVPNARPHPLPGEAIEHDAAKDCDVPDPAFEERFNSWVAAGQPVMP